MISQYDYSSNNVVFDYDIIRKLKCIALALDLSII